MELVWLTAKGVNAEVLHDAAQRLAIEPETAVKSIGTRKIEDLTNKK